MQTFFSHAYSSKFSFFNPDRDMQFSGSPKSKPDSGGELANTEASQGTKKTLKAFTLNILSTFKQCNDKFSYDPVHNPKRCLTYPPEGTYNNGYDNINNEYIIYVNDIIKSPENHEYQILELLGKGTFGQVVRCQRKGTKEEFALKIIKNKPAYTNQALTEVKIYRKLKEENQHNENYVVKLYDYFVFRNHICLLFEILHISLYDLLQLSNFSGFSLRFIARLTQQLLEGMVCLEKNKIIHCDLKPENILFADDQSDAVKLIDLGSSCFLHSTLYTYIQSRFYRAPEVILGLKYTHKIDSWSLGCIVAEFYLGLPLFPGSSEYDLLKRVIEVIGMPENEVIEMGRFKNKFFNKEDNNNYVFKPQEEYEKEQNIKLPPHKKYFILNKLEDLEMYYNKSKQREKQPQDRQRFDCFLHFLKGVLELNPLKRWSASQALYHPFITNAPFEPNWEPLSPEIAIDTFNKMLESQENKLPAKKSVFEGFSNTGPTQSLNAESYRPFIPLANTDKKEEVLGQSQNVYLLNNQINSNKPKSKLNPNAGTFNPTSFQIPSLNPDMISKGSEGDSHSEPNSARSMDYKPRKKNYESNGKNDNKNSTPTYNNGGGGAQGGKSWEYKDKKNNRGDRKSQQYVPNQQGYTADTKYTQQSYTTTNQFSTDNSQYNDTSRHRSNSDQGINDKTYFNNNYGKQKHDKKRRGGQGTYNTGTGGYTNNINSQGIGNQPTPDTAETSNSSNEFEFKSKFSNTGNKQSHQDEMKEELKEDDLL